MSMRSQQVDCGPPVAMPFNHERCLHAYRETVGKDRDGKQAVGIFVGSCDLFTRKHLNRRGISTAIFLFAFCN